MFGDAVMAAVYLARWKKIFLKKSKNLLIFFWGYDIVWSKMIAIIIIDFEKKTKNSSKGDLYYG